MEIDHELIFAARRFITGANVHYVKTWVFCYETSLPGSPRRERYEALLRDLVRWSIRLQMSQRMIEMQWDKLKALSERQ